MSITIYKDSAAGAIFVEDASGAQFLNALQATIDGDNCNVIDLAKNFEIVSGIRYDQIFDENGLTYGSDSQQVCDNLNANFVAAGSGSNNPPFIKPPLSIGLVEGETLNYELITDYGVGYEWDFSNVPGVVNVEGNPRKIIGGSGLLAGTYNIPVKAINYNGEDSETIVLTVDTPPFANTKSINFNNNDYLIGNAGILQNVLGRSGNGSGASDAWTISLFFKAGTASNSSQTICYFGSGDIANQSHIQIKYDGSNNNKNIKLRYGSNNNNLQFETPTDSITVEQWQHVMITYDGGTTGSSSGSINDYYSRFNIFIDGVLQTTSNTNNNFGTTQSINAINWRIGRYNNGQNLRNNTKIDEFAIWSSDESANIIDIYNSGAPQDLSVLSAPPVHWWRMGDGDTFPFLLDSGSAGNLIMTMQNMNVGDIVSDVP